MIIEWETGSGSIIVKPEPLGEIDSLEMLGVLHLALSGKTSELVGLIPMENEVQDGTTN